MGQSKEVFMIMREDDYLALSPEQRLQCVYTEIREANEYEMHKNDPNYLVLKSAEKKAKKDVQDYLFNKRHNGTGRKI